MSKMVVDRSALEISNSDDDNVQLVSRGKKRKRKGEQNVKETKHFVVEETTATPKIISLFKNSPAVIQEPDHQQFKFVFQGRKRNVTPDEVELETKTFDNCSGDLKLWKNLVQKVVKTKPTANANLMKVLIADMSDLLVKFASLASRICQSGITDGEEILLCDFPLVQSVLKANKVYISNQISLFKELQSEMYQKPTKGDNKLEDDIEGEELDPELYTREYFGGAESASDDIDLVKEEIASDDIEASKNESASDDIEASKNEVWEYDKKVELDHETGVLSEQTLNSAGRKKLSNMQLLCEAIMHSKEKRLAFNEIIESIFKRHQYLKGEKNLVSFTSGLRVMLNRNNHFIKTEVTFNGVSSHNWSLSEELMKTIMYNSGSENAEELVESRSIEEIDFSMLSFPISHSKNTEQKVTKNAKGDATSWQPYCLVDKEVFTKMRAGNQPLECPNCGKKWSSENKSSIQGGIKRIMSHWKDMRCNKHIASLVAKEVTGTKYTEGEQRFACTHQDCTNSDKIFRSVTSVQSHYNSNHKDSFNGKMWQCPDCPMTFIAEFLMRAHVKKIHIEGKERYPCKFCGKSYMRKEKRSVHERYECLASSEARDAGFVNCEICGQKIRRGDSILHHKRSLHPELIGYDIEEAKKQNSCHLCGKGFISKYKLSEHMSSHNDKPDPKFQCPICNKYMKQSNSFRKHMVNVHKKGFTCEICQKMFYDADYLTRHLRDVHNKMSMDNRGTIHSFYSIQALSLGGIKAASEKRSY